MFSNCLQSTAWGSLRGGARLDAPRPANCHRRRNNKRNNRLLRWFGACSRVTTCQVKQGMSQAFEDLLRHRWVPALKKGGTSPTIYATSTTGGDSNAYVAGLGPNVGIEQVMVAEGFPARTLQELHIRRELGIMVLAIRRANGDMHLNPGPDHQVQSGDYLIVMGETASLRKLEKLLG